MLDVKGSTKVVQALSRQDYLTRVNTPVYAKLQALFTRYGGEMSGTPHGDDALVVFDDVNNALTCAVAIQEELPKLVAPDPEPRVQQLQVRIAVHRAVKETGPVDGNHYPNDPEVIYVARMLQYVEGGQVLASRETFDRSDNKRWQWQSWNNRLIEKWDETPQTLYELIYPGWKSLEPGIRFRPEWFRETNQYISRPALEQRIAALFARKTSNQSPYRLVTLHNIGGMGKTRLAVQVCLNSVGLFAGRLHFVTLEGISENLLTEDTSRCSYLAGQIAAEFGVEGEASSPQNLPAHLPIKESTLLLLDDYETVHGKASALLLGQILNRCPLLTILVTGREQVGLQNVELTEESLSFEDEEATRLFETRVQEKKADFDWQPNTEEKNAIASILTDTARIPLALELVAAHVKYIPLPALAADLHQDLLGKRTALPGGTYSDDPTERHETLEKCYDWSWKLLTETARQALMRISLFADNALQTEIQACFPQIEGKELEQLQNAALLIRSEDPHQNQFSLLNPTRHYGRKRLKASDTEQEIQRHFVVHYLSIVKANGHSSKFHVPGHLECLSKAFSHAMSAAQNAAERMDTDSCGDITDWLMDFVMRQALQRTAIPLFELALQTRRTLKPENLTAIANSLNDLALLYESQGRYSEAEPLYNEALKLDRAALPEGHPDIATDLNNLAALYERQGRYPEAEPLYNEALQIDRAALPEGHPDIATDLNNLAALYKNQGRYTEAEPLYREALTICERTLGPEHPHTKIVRGNLEIFLRERGT